MGVRRAYDYRKKKGSIRVKPEKGQVVKIMPRVQNSRYNQRFSQWLNHGMLAECYKEGSLDLYQGDPNENSYLLWEDGTSEVVETDDIDLILNIMSTPGGVDEDTEETVEQIIERSRACERTIARFHGEDTEAKYMKRIHCLKWWCPSCGTRTSSRGKMIPGEIQKNRRKAVFARLNGGFEICDKKDFEQFTRTLNTITMVQYVFTVPEGCRERFKSKEGLNRLFGSAKRIMAKEYPDTGQISYMHVTGDQSLEFHPHVNVQIMIPGDVRVCPPEGVEDLQLRRIKKSWARALRGHGCGIPEGVQDGQGVVVHKSFVSKNDNFKKKLHRIKYMSKTIDQSYLDKWRDAGRQDMIELAVKSLKGYRYIRYWGELSNSKYKQWYENILKAQRYTDKEVKEMNARKLRTREERLAGERLVLERVGIMDIDALMKNPNVKVTRLAKDFYKVEYDSPTPPSREERIEKAAKKILSLDQDIVILIH